MVRSGAVRLLPVHSCRFSRGNYERNQSQRARRIWEGRRVRMLPLEKWRFRESSGESRSGCRLQLPRRRRHTSPARAFCRSGANLTAQSAGGMHPVDREVSIGGSLTALSAGKRNPRCGFVGLVSLCRRFAVPQAGARSPPDTPASSTPADDAPMTGCRNAAAVVVATRCPGCVHPLDSRKSQKTELATRSSVIQQAAASLSLPPPRRSL
jgi:hypothetical protein